MKLICLFSIFLFLSSCVFKPKKYIKVFVAEDFCGSVYIVPDRNSTNFSNELQIDNSGLYLMNYDSAEEYNDYDLKVLKGDEDVTDLCVFSNGTSGHDGIRVIYKSIDIQCAELGDKTNNDKLLSEIIREKKIEIVQ